MNYDMQSAVHAAACAWFVYEYLLNVDDEVELVWSRGPTWTNLVYILTNGLTVSALVIGLLVEADLGCVTFPIYIGAWGFIISALSDLLLTARIYYMYDCSRRLLIISLVLYGCVVASALVNDAINLPFHQEPSHSGTRSCFDHRNINRFGVAITTVIGFLYQAYLGSLAVAKVRQAYAHRKLLRSRGLLALLVEGNLLYYSIMAIIYGVPIIVAFRESISAETVLTYFMVTTIIKDVLAHKLFRDMRRVLTPDLRDPTFSTVASPSHEIGGFHMGGESEGEVGEACV